jgi:small subunit ribosomal protein S8
MNDTIADLLTRVSDAKFAGRKNLVVPFSKINLGILAVLKEEGYIGDYKSEEKQITISLEGSSKDFEKIRRVSRPGRRAYVKSKNIPKPKGYGMVIVSTPDGILSGSKAKKSGIGGELICEVF